jgi:hypothetical protein
MSSSRRLARVIAPSPPASATPSGQDSTISQITAGVIAVSDAGGGPAGPPRPRAGPGRPGSASAGARLACLPPAPFPAGLPAWGSGVRPAGAVAAMAASRDG